MDKKEILEKYQDAVEIKPMIYVGVGDPVEKRYYVKEKCGIVILNEDGITVKRIPNVTGKSIPKTFKYAGPYMLIDNTLYYCDEKTKYRCDDIYYEDGLLECYTGEDYQCTTFFLIDGKALKRGFFRRLYTRKGWALITKKEKNDVIRLRIGNVERVKDFYGIVGKRSFYSCSPLVEMLKVSMDLEDEEVILMDTDMD